MSDEERIIAQIQTERRNEAIERACRRTPEMAAMIRAEADAHPSEEPILCCDLMPNGGIGPSYYCWMGQSPIHLPVMDVLHQ